MTTELVGRDDLESTLKTALERGGEFAEVFVEDRVARSASLDQSRIEDMSSSRDRGAGVRVVVGSTTGFAHTTDLTTRGLHEAARAAAAAARGGGGGVREVSLGLIDAHVNSARETTEAVGADRRVEFLRKAEAAARSGFDAISQVQVGVGDSERRFVVANSDGTYASDHQVRTRLTVRTVANGDTGMQTGFDSHAAVSGYEVFDDEVIHKVASEAARRATTKLSARPAPTGDLPVVLAGGSGGILFHEACGHGLEADAIVKGASVYAGRVGEQVASSLVTVVDDGSFAGEWGYAAIDDEGRPSQRNVLIQDGVLTDYMWDLLRSRREGRASSGNGRRQGYQYLPMVRMTNTYVEIGNEDEDEIIAQTPYGIYVAQLGGGQVNTTTGDFVFGMTEAYLIEDGRITAPLRECNLIGNGPEVLGRVDAIGRDFSMGPGTCGKDGQQVPVGCGQATMRLTGITIGGAA